MNYKKIIATGGIGIGMLFQSQQMETLGRSESRLVTLSNAKDYCKQHIVLYYTAMLASEYVKIYPIGYVGKDANGNVLIREMEKEGMDVSYIGQSEEEQTMLSVCLQYPDKEGCNFTAMNNAVLHVTGEYIAKSMDRIGIDSETIVLAAPEVSIECRIEMLKKGKAQQAFCVLSIPVMESGIFLEENIFSYCDLLAVNKEEAQALIGSTDSGTQLVKKLYELLSSKNENIELLVTCGKDGAYSASKGKVEFIPPLDGKVVNTTGAGDAFLGGTIAGVSLGLNIQKGHSDRYFGETKLSSAVELGTLCAGMAVESRDSIAFHVTKDTIREKIAERGWKVEPWFIK